MNVLSVNRVREQVDMESMDRTGTMFAQLKNMIETHYRVCVLSCFVVFLIVGLSIYKDYGLSWDEELTRIHVGQVNYHYLVTGDSKPLLSSVAKYYGPAIELVLISIEKLLGQSDPREIYFTRHLVTFLVFFVGVCFFYLICRGRFGSWKMGLLGCAILVLSPRIFADAFYNQKDLAFLSVFIVSMYTLLKFLEAPSYARAIAHGVVCAFLIATRILGVFMPVLTVALIAADWLVLARSKQDARFAIGHIVTYAVALVGFTILFWPLLWEGRLGLFVEAFREMSRYPWTGSVLYLGDVVKATALPWHYIPVWISITTPVIYLVLFLIGVLLLGTSLLRSPGRFVVQHSQDLVFLLCFFLPLGAVIALHSVLYDAWRHMFFIYPAFVMIAMYGLSVVYERLQAQKNRAVRWSLPLLIGAALGGTLVTMIKLHPYQNVYFNPLAGPDMQAVKARFELDYWGLSYRKGLEYILEHDPSPTISVVVANYPGFLNSRILPPDQRKRLRYTDRLEDSDYFLGNYREHKEDYPLPNEFFSLKLDEAKILVVHKLR